MSLDYTIRKAILEDKPALERLIALSVLALCAPDYTAEQIEGALRGAFGVDTDLIRDGTYFVAETNKELIGCGGWSKRKTFLGGDRRTARDADVLDPRHDAAKIRAFFTHPNRARRRIAKAILTRCEDEARAHGFRALELMAALPGLRFYAALGFAGSEPVNHELTPGLVTPFVLMKKLLV